mmetsp:Transcript_33582/g.72810  ORF Transcript_33582/g.72810 Transcript_33582/m.72810 type:complete len:100 (+) Transcript_33582:1680-1979(+)
MITFGQVLYASLNFCSFFLVVAHRLFSTDLTTFSPSLQVMTKNRVLLSSNRGLLRKPRGSARAVLTERILDHRPPRQSRKWVLQLEQGGGSKLRHPELE